MAESISTIDNESVQNLDVAKKNKDDHIAFRKSIFRILKKFYGKGEYYVSLEGTIIKKIRSLESHH